MLANNAKGPLMKIGDKIVLASPVPWFTTAITTGGGVKRYLVFFYAFYYPCGGWNDFVGSVDTIKEAEELAKKERHDPSGSDFQIVDLQIMKVVAGDSDGG
jgi:hypothetical protein